MNFTLGSRTDAASLRRLRRLAQDWLDAHCGSGRLATVAALPCREPGCPPFETIVQVVDDEMPLAFALKKLPEDVSTEELEAALEGARAEWSRRREAAPPPPQVRDATSEAFVEGGGVVAEADLERVVRSVVEATEAIDVHTHLFPPAQGELMSWGMDALLTYHYLVSEFFVVAADVTHEVFFALDRPRQASLVWSALFVARTPVSEAQVGVLTTLARLGVPRVVVDAARARDDLAGIRAWFAARDRVEHTRAVFAAAKVRYVVMTNVPFDATEASKYVEVSCCINPATSAFFNQPTDDDDSTDDGSCGGRFRTALRVDALLAGDWAVIAASLRLRGLDASLDSAKVFLRAWAKRYKAEYLMASTPADFKYGRADDAPLEPGWPTCTDLVDEVLVPIAAELNLALALKLGAVRGMAPDLNPCGGGDGVEVASTAPLKALCSKNPKLKILATFLSKVNQHEACVLAQKFRNLHLYGCWWYCNNPSIITELTQMRLELLGTAFTAQHSDCRVLEQLVYKWAHSRRLIAAALTRQYAHLLATGCWTLTLAEVHRDVRSLLGGAYEAFLAKDLSLATGVDRAKAA